MVVNGTQTLIFLDFDGVLFDTVREAYVVSLNALGVASGMDGVDFGSEHYRIFRRYRYLITSAWTYLYLLRAMEEVGETGVPERFDALSGCADPHDRALFDEAFFKVRQSFKRQNYRQWLELNDPYPFLLDVRSEVEGDPESFFIITTKDEATVEDLLHELQLPFRDGQIIGRNRSRDSVSKGEIIASLMDERRVLRAVFVDDSSHHLASCRDVAGLVLLQPDWGYAAPGDPTIEESRVMNEIRNALER